MLLLLGHVVAVVGGQGGVLAPHGGVLAPHDGVLAPHVGMLAPHVGMLAPHAWMLTPHAWMLAPHAWMLAWHVGVHAGMLAPHCRVLATHGRVVAPHAREVAPQAELPADALLELLHPAPLRPHRALADHVQQGVGHGPGLRRRGDGREVPGPGVRGPRGVASPPLLLVGAGYPDGGRLLPPQAPRHLLQASPPARLHLPWATVTQATQGIED